MLALFGHYIGLRVAVPRNRVTKWRFPIMARFAIMSELKRKVLKARRLNRNSRNAHAPTREREAKS